MTFRNEILCLALAGTAAAFAPPSPAALHGRSMRMGGQGGDLSPQDLIASDMKLKSVFQQTNTLRWEMRSTLTSDEEAKTVDGQAEGDGGDGGDGDGEKSFPDLLANGIYEIKSPDEHA